MHQPTSLDKVLGVIYPGYMAAKRHEAWLLKKHGPEALSTEALNKMPGLATEEYMHAQEQLGDKYNDPQTVDALRDQYVAQRNAGLHLQADVKRTEKTIGKPALDAIELMTTIAVTEGLGALDGPVLRPGLRSNREPAALTPNREAGEPAPGVVPEAPARPAEPAPSSASAAPVEPQPRSLTDIQARDWYNGELAKIDQLEAKMHAEGRTVEEIFWKVSPLRNTVKMQARDLMQDQELAKSLPPPTPPEEVLKKYNGNYEAAIAASKRSNTRVNKEIEDRRASGEK